jgi:hypothetical protein
MHEKRLARSAVPDGEGKLRIYPNGSLETLVTFEKEKPFLERDPFLARRVQEDVLVG